MNTAKDYKNFGDVSEHKLAKYLRDQTPEWGYEQCGEYTIYFKPLKDNKYETLAVTKHDNSCCTKEVFIPNDKVGLFQKVLK